MKQFFSLFLIALLCVACNQKNDKPQSVEMEEIEISDSTLYGICGEGTMMHTLELITSMQDTLSININDVDLDEPTMVVGGLMCGDRMAVTAMKTDGEWTAQRIINLTSLLGKWTSIDKSFQITDDGEVISDVKTESKSWTSWRILNGQLLLNRDTFDIVTLDADSLELENSNGIFFYKRLRNASFVID